MDCLFIFLVTSVSLHTFSNSIIEFIHIYDYINPEEFQKGTEGLERTGDTINQLVAEDLKSARSQPPDLINMHRALYCSFQIHMEHSPR